MFARSERRAGPPLAGNQRTQATGGNPGVSEPRARARRQGSRKRAFHCRGTERWQRIVAAPRSRASMSGQCHVGGCKEPGLHSHLRCLRVCGLPVLSRGGDAFPELGETAPPRRFSLSNCTWSISQTQWVVVPPTSTPADNHAHARRVESALAGRTPRTDFSGPLWRHLARSNSRFGSPLNLAGALGATRGHRGSDLPHMDGGQTAAAGIVSGPAGGQVTPARRAADSAPAWAARRFRMNRWVTVGASREVLLLKFFH